MVFRGIGETLARVALVALLIGAVWLTLQFHTEDELVEKAREFWAWWSTLLTGDLLEPDRRRRGAHGDRAVRDRPDHTPVPLPPRLRFTR